MDQEAEAHEVEWLGRWLRPWRRRRTGWRCRRRVVHAPLSARWPRGGRVGPDRGPRGGRRTWTGCHPTVRELLTGAACPSCWYVRIADDPAAAADARRAGRIRLLHGGPDAGHRPGPGDRGPALPPRGRDAPHGIVGLLRPGRAVGGIGRALPAARAGEIPEDARAGGRARGGNGERRGRDRRGGPSRRCGPGGHGDPRPGRDSDGFILGSVAESVVRSSSRAHPALPAGGCGRGVAGGGVSAGGARRWSRRASGRGARPAAPPRPGRGRWR
jgi:hypothetical protein